MMFLLRRILHSESETERKKSERFTTNRKFKPEKNISSLFYPIPEVIENKCQCGEEGVCMDESMQVICPKCLLKLIGQTKLEESKVLVIPSIEQARLGNIFEWEPQGTENWYKIKGRSIIAGSKISISKEEIQKRLNEIMLKVLFGEPQLLDGDYEKETKLLTIWV